MSEITRRSFVGASAAAAAALTATASAFAEPVDVTAPAVAGANQDQQALDGVAFYSDELLQKVMDEPQDVQDIVRSDGSVIPAVYVKLRNRINRMGKGIGGHVTETSFDCLMKYWSEEDAAHELEMPMFGYFTPYDYAMVSGRPEAECREILADLASRCLIFHAKRSGCDYYLLLPHINGFWEFRELKEYFDHGLEGVTEFNNYNIWDAEGPGFHDFEGTLPLFRSYPLSSEVVAEDELAPYMDWRAVMDRHSIFTVSPCQCRLMFQGMGMSTGDFPVRTCISLGEVAEYFIENGIGEEITKEEAIAIVEDAIDFGMVPESIATKDVDIICCCHSDVCGNLSGFAGTRGTNANAGKNFNAYNLQYDADACLKCGACVARCPMHSITFNDEGVCVHDDVCVRCGQCVAVCPAAARVLVAREDFVGYPLNYPESHSFTAKDRMARGLILDCLGGTIA